MLLKIAATYILVYLAGSIPTSIITCRVLRGIDIRKSGSGNAGATNVYRVLGLKPALFVLFVDALKGVFGVFAPLLILNNTNSFISHKEYFMIAGGLVAIVGHIWTVFAGFKGGKGIGTALGVFFALLPVQAIICLALWIIIVAVTRIVSIASIAAGITLAATTVIFYCTDTGQSGLPMVYFTMLVALLIIFTHRANISRLLKRTENRIELGKKKNITGNS